MSTDVLLHTSCGALLMTVGMGGWEVVQSAPWTVCSIHILLYAYRNAPYGIESS